VVKRFTWGGPETLNYEVTIADPTVWTKPWMVRIPVMSSGAQMFEHACHEGSIGMDGILTGHRAEELVGSSR